MSIQEFSDMFDLLYNNVTSNQAPGLNEWEKSVFLTKAEKEIVKNYFSPNSAGNTLKQGFDDSAKRQADFSVLMKTSTCDVVNSLDGNYFLKKYMCKVGITSPFLYLILKDEQVSATINNEPYTIPEGVYNVTLSGSVYTTTIEGNTVVISGLPLACTQITVGKEAVSTVGQIDDRSIVYQFPTDTFIVVNEAIKTSDGRYLQVIPLRYDEYTRLMSKPFKYPVKNQAWRLMNSGEVNNTTATKYVEIITNIGDTVGTYNIRYVRVPKPIIVDDLGELSIDGQHTASTECEIDPILHEDILQRAVELAKVAWTQTGQDNTQAVIAAGQRSE